MASAILSTIAKVALGGLKWLAERFFFFRAGVRHAERKGLERDAKNAAESRQRREGLDRLDDDRLDQRVRRSQE